METQNGIAPNGGTEKRGPRRLLVIGLALLVISLITIVTLYANRSKYTETEGTIVGFSDGDRPVVEYRVGGESYLITLSSSRDKDRKGDVMTVLYRGDAPEKGKAERVYYSVPIAFAFIGGILAIVSLVIGRVRKKQAEREEAAVAAAQYGAGPDEEDVTPPLALRIFTNLFFYLGLALLGFAVFFLILKISDPENNSFIPVIVLAFIGAVHTGIGAIIRKVFGKTE